MKVGIMQPYFFPYVGYFQLINAVDEFVIYDNIEFTKKGWINRNRVLVNGADAYITLPLKKDSDYLKVCDRVLADSWEDERKKMLNRITESYRKAPQYNDVFPVVQKSILFDDPNLFNFIFNSIRQVNQYLGIGTRLIISSSISIDHSLKSEKKVMEICKSIGADTYINPIGGIELYSKEEFSVHGIALQFLKSKDIIYTQLKNEFVPWLSIIDVMMFNPLEKIREYLSSYYSLQ